jgi:hypothetical protein
MTSRRARLTPLLALLLALPCFAASTGPISEETPPATCDPGSVVSEVRCTGSNCDNITISCAVLGKSFVGSSRWTEWVSEEQKTRACPDNYYIAGFACRGSYCDDVSLYCVEFPTARRVSCGLTARVSEENGGELSFLSQGDKAGQKFAARSLTCTGSYCDNMQFDVCEIVVN